MVLEIFLTFDPFPGWAISLGLIRDHVANTNYMVGSDKVVRLVIFEGDVAWEGVSLARNLLFMAGDKC